MSNTYFEGSYIPPEEIREFVLSKFEDASENPDRYHELFIDYGIGYSPKEEKASYNVHNAIIAIKYKTDVVCIRVVDGKIVGTRPDDFYLVYRPNKFLVCALRQGENASFVKIKDEDACSVEFDITVFVMIQHEDGIFSVFYTPDIAKFTEPIIAGNEIEMFSFAKSIKRFFHLPSTFRSLPKDSDEGGSYE